ncbi:hypothetical protein ACWN8R_02405 [Pediococcus acidilactici]|uniref:hypothetical protein n=1 Tax=Pediococcus acidilactici TaxID=1254 RepID=UPI001353879A|nr:hypothetical protein [Pediococcus acidilactici]KAF0373134.1 hypothetical protein GBO58_02560 [Pediococcus acidilactici]MDB8877098.1 hypothetical protein [Pediococcus acidilactici]
MKRLNKSVLKEVIKIFVLFDLAVINFVIAPVVVNTYCGEPWSSLFMALWWFPTVIIVAKLIAEQW